MTDLKRQTATRLLRETRGGSVECEQQLLPLVYDEMRRLADNLLRGARGQTLQATALVHEAWLRMIDEKELTGSDPDEMRRRFLGLAARAMRWVIVDHARSRKAGKRGGDRHRVTFTEGLVAPDVDAAELLDLDEALQKLEEFKPRLARVAELRLFGGLSAREVAAALDIGVTTATDEWALARALLLQHLGEGHAKS